MHSRRLQAINDASAPGPLQNLLAIFGHFLLLCMATKYTHATGVIFGPIVDRIPLRFKKVHAIPKVAASSGTMARCIEPFFL